MLVYNKKTDIIKIEFKTDTYFMCFIHNNKLGHCGLAVNQSISESKHSVSQTTKTKQTTMTFCHGYNICNNVIWHIVMDTVFVIMLWLFVIDTILMVHMNGWM